MNTTTLPQTLPGTDPVADARFMLAHPEVAHSPLHCRQIVAGLLAQRDQMLAALQAEQEWQERDKVGALDPEWDYEFMVGNKRRAALPKAQGSAT